MIVKPIIVVSRDKMNTKNEKGDPCPQCGRILDSPMRFDETIGIWVDISYECYRCWKRFHDWRIPSLKIEGIWYKK